VLRIIGRAARAALPACFIALATPAVADPAARPVAAPSQEVAALAARAVQLTYMRESAQRWRDLLLGQAATPDCGCGMSAETKAKVAAAWRRAVAAGFDAGRFEDDMRGAIAAGLDAGDLKRWMAFYETDLGRRIHAAERPQPPDKTPPQQAMAEMQRLARRLDATPDRKRVLQDLAASMGGADFAVEVMMSFSLGTALGSAAALPKGQPRMEEAEIIALVEKQRPIFHAVIAPTLVPTLSRIYRPLTTAELRTYHARMMTPTGRKFTSTFLAAYRLALRRQALTIGAAFATEFSASDI